MAEKNLLPTTDPLAFQQHEKSGLHGPIALPVDDAHASPRRITRYLTLRNFICITLAILTTSFGLLALHHHRPSDEPVVTPQAYFVRGFSDAACRNEVFAISGGAALNCQPTVNRGGLPATHVRYAIDNLNSVTLFAAAGCPDEGASQTLHGNSGGCLALNGPVVPVSSYYWF